MYYKYVLLNIDFCIEFAYFNYVMYDIDMLMKIIV